MRAALVLGALIACGGERRDPPARVAAPPAPREPAAWVPETTPCPPPRTDDPVDLTAFLCAARTAPKATALDLDDLLARLPPRFRKNVTLKHGARRPGERGHVQDTVGDSPSASPAALRMIAWDETTGFSITYDGTTPPVDAPPRVQRGAHRLGMLSVDPRTASFALWAIDLPLRHDGSWQVTPYQPTDAEDDCTSCHGPDSRPIWPMYPDWPGFIGSDNDEVTRDTAVQRDELRWLRDVRTAAIATSAPAATAPPTGPTPTASARAATLRLASLFAPALDAYLAHLFAHLDLDAIRAYLRTRVKPTAALVAAATGDDAVLRTWLGLELHPTYPYRANHELQLAEASRALFHRPNSRAGMLYNRLQARRVMTRIRATAAYASHPALVALTVMDCGWPGDLEARTKAYAALTDTAKIELAAAATAPPAGERILYPVLLGNLGLRVRDVDIRLSHRSAEYDRFDRAYVIPSIAKTVMDIGYIAYPNPRATINGAKLYWMSYFDGSASLDELLALAMLEDLAAKDPVLATLYRPMSLAEKYGEVAARYALDRPFFTEMDRLGRWLPLPYPDHLGPVHHRESFTKKRGGPDPQKFTFPVQYRAVCERLRTTLHDQYGP